MLICGIESDVVAVKVYDWSLRHDGIYWLVISAVYRGVCHYAIAACRPDNVDNADLKHVKARQAWISLLDILGAVFDASAATDAGSLRL